MDFFKKAKKRLVNSLSEKLFSLDALQEALPQNRNPKGSMSDRLIRRYASVSEEEPEPTLTTTLFRKLRLRRSSSVERNSKRFIQLSKRLSDEDLETNKKRLGVVADLMSVFIDDEDKASSDQDEMIEELQDIGYIITPKVGDTNTHTNNNSMLDDDVFRLHARGTKDTKVLDGTEFKKIEGGSKDNVTAFKKIGRNMKGDANEHHAKVSGKLLR